jgi:hypothetical protein
MGVGSEEPLAYISGVLFMASRFPPQSDFIKEALRGFLASECVLIPDFV